MLFLKTDEKLLTINQVFIRYLSSHIVQKAEISAHLHVLNEEEKRRETTKYINSVVG